MLVRDIEIKAGFRDPGGSERIRVRRAVPRVQAVVVVKEGKICVGEDSRVERVWGWAVSMVVCGLWMVGGGWTYV